MFAEFKIFFIRLLGLALVAPIVGYGLLLSSEQLEKAWKTGKRKNKWIALSFVFIFVAILFGWLK